MSTISIIPGDELRLAKKNPKNILHAGRLGSYSKIASTYTSSIEVDRRLVNSVAKINSAHVLMLAEQGIIGRDAARKILLALHEVPENLEMKDDLEDVHMNVEDFVISRIGPEAGGMMNLAKSRNDQVATALRMVLRRELLAIGEAIIALEKSLLEQAVKHAGMVVPGYTHLQRGQPVTLGHHLLAHFDSVDRNFARLVDCYLRTDLSPMGAGALASTGFRISRERTADLLGFGAILENSLDAVSSRDFGTEAIYLCAQTMTDLSRLAEELILWTTSEFSFAELPDEFSSTSSMMPQKKNAIVPEIFRARTSQVLGDLLGAMGIVKALPLSYNLDLQELTRNLWSATDRTYASVSTMAGVVRETKFATEKMAEAARDEFLYATELADFLVSRFGIPFRDAHSRVATLAKHAIQRGRRESQFTSLDPKVVSEILGVSLNKENYDSIFDPSYVLAKRKVVGSPNPKLVSLACNARQKTVAKHEATLASLKQALASSDELLESLCGRIMNLGRADGGSKKLTRREVK